MADILGLREAKATFQKMPEVFRDALNDATFQTVSEIVRGAKARVQASPSIRTRALLNAIGFVMNRKTGRGRAGIQNVSTTMAIAGRKVRVRGIVQAGRGGSASRATGARLIQPRRYAHLIEFGARHHRAEPFMIPATESQKSAYLDRCRAAGRNAAGRLAAMGGRTL